MLAEPERAGDGDPADVRRPAAAHVRLGVESVSVRRGDRLLFRDVSLALGGGEILHLRGPNGSGKTTLLRVIAGLTEPETGRVVWRGRPTAGLERQAFEQAMVWSGHRDGLKSDLTVRENLRFHQRLAGCNDPARIAAAAERLEITRLLDLPGGVLSAGQRRRSALARLLLRPAELWLLDEPFTNLDADGCETVRELLVAHAAAGGIAIVAAHGELGFGHPGLREAMLGAAA